jgi:hypothetical protein
MSPRRRHALALARRVLKRGCHARLPSQVVDVFSPAKFYKKHKCLVITLGVITLLVALIAATYHAPELHVSHESANADTVAKWVDHAHCHGAGFPSRLTPSVNENGTTTFNFECKGIRVSGKAFFTLFILLVCLVLMVQNYPADLVMLAGTVIFFVTGIIPAEKGAYRRPLWLLVAWAPSPCAQLHFKMVVCGWCACGHWRPR